MQFFFSCPKSKQWINACNVLKRYTNKCNAKHPELLTSCKLRKHIASVTQVLNLRENEKGQFSKFMCHTLNTHEQFYKLPEDVYQVAKVAKILYLMEKGKIADFKNKNLDEIDINLDEELEDSEDEEEEELEEETVDDPPTPKRKTLHEENNKKKLKTEEKIKGRIRWTSEQKKYC